ncbi:MAG TPA: RHS repeat-associated core domain-containing protein, partial [Cytophagaceae bacterium]
IFTAGAQEFTPQSVPTDVLTSQDVVSIKRVQAEVEFSTNTQVFVWHEFEQGSTTSRNIRVIVRKGAILFNNIIHSGVVGDQLYPTVKVNQLDGSFIVAWASNHGGNYDIYAKKIFFNDLASAVTTPEVKINPTESTARRQIVPFIAIDHVNNEIVFAWRDWDGQDGSEHGAYGRRMSNANFSLNGLATEQFLINGTTSLSQTLTDLDINPTTNQLYAMYTSYSSTNDNDVVFRRFVRSDAPSGYTGLPEVIVNNYKSNVQDYGSLEINKTTGDYTIAWNSKDQEGSGLGFGVYSKIFDRYGQEVKGEFRVIMNLTSANNYLPKAIWDESTNRITYFYYRVETGGAVYIRHQMLDDQYNQQGLEKKSITVSTNEMDLKAMSGGYLWPVYNPSLRTVLLPFDGFAASTTTSSKAYFTELTYFDAALVSPSSATCATDKNYNWQNEKTFDENGNIISESRAYSDRSGRHIQSQTKNFIENKIFATATIYDELGNAAIQTLPAPTNSSTNSFCYNDNFVTTSGVKYSSIHFNKPISTNAAGEINNPFAVDATLDKLGWYYSTGNTYEPYQDLSSYPYSRVYSPNLGNLAKATNPGNSLKMGLGREKIQISMSIKWELNHYISLRERFVPNINEEYGSTVTTMEGRGQKSIVRDENGVETVTFSDREGKVLATCVTGKRAGMSYLPVPADGPTYIRPGQTHDVHIPFGVLPSEISINTGTSYTIYDLEADRYISSITKPGYYRVTNTGTDFNMPINYPVTYHDFTYYYYDDASRLVATVPPTSINYASTALPTGITTYTYNTLGQVLSVTSPDEGKIEYVYRNDGQVAFSQDAKQKPSNSYSYSVYDDLGRGVEVGEFTPVTGKTDVYWFQNMKGEPALGTGQSSTLSIRNNSSIWLNKDQRKYRTYTVFDQIFAGTTTPTGRTQRYIDGRVACTFNEDGVYVPSKTWYSYDEHGRLEWTAQQYSFADGTSMAPKFIDYEYDYSGNLRKTIFQKDAPTERFEHVYSYDYMQRLQTVKTRFGTAGLSLRAKYKYYMHGPVKRVELDGNLQGIDYVYTVDGKLKGINHPALSSSDPGSDGFSNTAFNKDAFGMHLDYYENDYTRSTNFKSSINLNGYNEQFNGMIRSMVISQPTSAAGGLTSPTQYAYKYDEKYQLTNADHGYRYGASTFAIDSEGKYSASYAYDPNGNITRQVRKGDGTAVHNFSNYYKYSANSLIGLSSTANGTTNRTFSYDEIGQMTFDNQDKNMKYDVFGKMISYGHLSNYTIKNTSFAYDEGGNRIRKISENIDVLTGQSSSKKNTLYVNDASGNTMAIYESSGTSANTWTLLEMPVYGVGRIGVYYPGSSEYNYELNDHLGNVRALVRRNSTTKSLDVLARADYFPYGSVMPGRNLVNSPAYRNGYQGQFAEKDAETGFDAFDLRMYDANLGRWISPDPYGQFHSPYVGMGNNPVSQVDPDGGFTFTAGLFMSMGMKMTAGGMVGGMLGMSNGGMSGAVGGSIGGAAAGLIGPSAYSATQPNWQVLSYIPLNNPGQTGIMECVFMCEQIMDNHYGGGRTVADFENDYNTLGKGSAKNGFSGNAFQLRDLLSRNFKINSGPNKILDPATVNSNLKANALTLNVIPKDAYTHATVINGVEMNKNGKYRFRITDPASKSTGFSYRLNAKSLAKNSKFNITVDRILR